MPDLRPPRSVVSLIRDREGRYFAVRPHGESVLEVVAGTSARFVIRILDVDGRPIPVRGLRGLFTVHIDGAVWDTWNARPHPSLRNALVVEMTPAQTAAMRAGRHRWTVDVTGGEDGPVRLMHARHGGAWGEIVVHRDDAPPAVETWRFDEFTPHAPDHDPLVTRWYTSPVPGPATSGRPVSMFTVAFRFASFTGTIGVEIDPVSVTADASPQPWVVIGPRFDGSPMEITDGNGPEAWSIEADCRWIRAWWQPSTMLPDPGGVTTIWIAV